MEPTNTQRKKEQGGGDDLIFLGGLWLNTSRNGNKYMSGQLGLGGKLMIFRNANADSKPGAPDYLLYITSKPEPKTGGGNDEPPF